MGDKERNLMLVNHLAGWRVWCAARELGGRLFAGARVGDALDGDTESHASGGELESRVPVQSIQK